MFDFVLKLKEKRAEIIANGFKGCNNAAKAIVNRVSGVRK